jgi:GNAT superfamily N-acetyltransferase/acyl carrier protein
MQRTESAVADAEPPPTRVLDPGQDAFSGPLQLKPEEIRKAVLAAIKTIAPEADVQKLRPDLPLRAQVDLDSLDWLNVIAGLHQRLSIDVAESDYGRLSTLNAIVAFVTSRQTPPRGKTACAPEPVVAGLPLAHHTVNGALVTVRPVRRDDAALEADFFNKLSTDARYKRFMATVADLPLSKLTYLTDVDQVRHVALVATADRDGAQALVGAVRYVVDASGRNCEFAVTVDDDWRSTGLAGILMHMLISIARSRGLATMYGLVLATNHGMLKFTRQLGFQQQHEPDDFATVRVTLAL